jgi:hypothetical protein
MKSFNQVYTTSKREVLAQRAQILEAQKVEVVKAIKEMYMITVPFKELPKNDLELLKNKVLEYWSPTTGLNKAGEKLLNEKEVTINRNSSKADLRLYIESQVKKHLNPIMEAYRRMDVDSVTQAFSEDMKNKTGRNINKQFIKNTVWNLIENRFKNGVQ